MRTRLIAFTALALATACRLGATPATPATPASQPAPGPAAAKHLRALSGEAELGQMFAAWKKQAEAREREERKRLAKAGPMPTAVASPPPPPPAPAPAATEAAAPAFAVASAAAADESITNVQTAGVDEGGIVKRHGDHLVVLRRGRLFTVKIGGDALQPVSRIDAFPPGTDGRGDWYDEMLVAGDTVAVIGYSYARGGTEVGLFDIDANGRLAHRSTWHMRGSDYYSASNYASRLVGNTLVFYTPVRLNPWASKPLEHFPGYRRWQPQATPEAFKRILPATRIYRTDDELDPFDHGVTLHTVTRCDLAGREMACESTAVMGPSGRVFYVSQDAVYVWTTRPARGQQQMSQSAVFRIPLDGAHPAALKTSGGPLDQMSFLQGSDGYLNVLLRADSAGEGMWQGARQRGDMALLRVRLDAFGDGSSAAPASAYRSVPAPGGYGVQNRFIGDWLVYGNAGMGGWGREAKATGRAYALRYADAATAVQEIELGHGVERIEAMGSDAVLVGNAGPDLLFSSLRLASTAALASSHARPNARQGESRTHGFFYKPTGERQGLVGLPILQARGAAVAYLRNDQLRLHGMGQLQASGDGRQDDGCQASCVDWYGNARPIFIGERVFALMGYELVEGRLEGQRIGERRRIDFGPVQRAQAVAD